jgi:hypothetical protein
MNSVVNQRERAILVFLYTTRPGQGRQAKAVPPGCCPKTLPARSRDGIGNNPVR